MKRFLSIFVAIVMAMTMVVPAFAYTDTKDSDYNAAITFLSGLGVVDGYDDGSYQPGKIVTRAEMAKLLVVALGLEAGASLLEGTSSFNDVPTTHWATGYIAVAVQYGLIKGDGDGNFRPDDTVNYAEVATMILRALGYDRVVDKNGQWPTNYLNKANELKIFEDIVNKFEGTDGATRGTVAQMLWNMLNTRMWVVLTENETDGLNYGKGDTMLTIKFPDYKFFEELDYANYNVAAENNEWQVYLNFNMLGWDEESIIFDYIDADEGILYAENDFYSFVSGTEFEALIYAPKKADPIIVSMFATDDNILVEGNAIDLEDTYTNYTASANTTYAYLLLNSSRTSANVNGSVEIAGVANSFVVTDVQETKAATKVYSADNTIEYTINAEGEEYDEVLVIKDGERATVLDLEIGDVVTLIKDSNEKAVLGIVTDEAIEGDYEAYNEEVTKDTETKTIEIDGDEIDVRTFKAYIDGLKDSDNSNIFYVEDEEEVSLTVSEAKANVLTEEEKDNEYLYETATLYFNAFGDLVKVVFGEVEDIAVEGNFYLVTTGKMWAVADSEGSVDYIQLANEDGTKSYAISEDLSADELKAVKEALTAGTIVWVLFDDEGAIEEVTSLAGDDVNKVVNEDNETEFNIVKNAGTLDEDTNYVGNYKIASSTVVYTYTEILDEDDKGTGKYKLEISKGAEELEGIENKSDIILALEADETTKVAYAFVAGEAESTDKHIGIVKAESTRLDVTYVTIGEDKYELDAKSDIGADKFEPGMLVVYTLNDDEIKVSHTFDVAAVMAEAGKVVKVDGEIVKFDTNFDADSIEVILDLDLLATDEPAITTGSDELKKVIFEDYRVFALEVEYDKNDNPYFDVIEEIDIADVELSKNQAVNFNQSLEGILIINGLDWDAYQASLSQNDSSAESQQ